MVPNGRSTKQRLLATQNIQDSQLPVRIHRLQLRIHMMLRKRLTHQQAMCGLLLSGRALATGALTDGTIGGIHFTLVTPTISTTTTQLMNPSYPSTLVSGTSYSIIRKTHREGF